jgi:hypothetical protein
MASPCGIERSAWKLRDIVLSQFHVMSGMGLERRQRPVAWPSNTQSAPPMDQLTTDMQHFSARIAYLETHGVGANGVPLDDALRWWNLGWVTQMSQGACRWCATPEGWQVIRAMRS